MTWVTGMTWTFWEAQMLKNGQEIAEENDVQKEIWKKKKERKCDFTCSGLFGTVPMLATFKISHVPFF